MKFTGMFSLLLVALLVLPFANANPDPVEPATLELTMLRDVANVNFASSSTYFQDDTISFSNSVMYTGGTTSSPVQNLDGCTITVVMGGTVGNVTTSRTVTGYVISTNDGTWGASISVPPITPCNIQVTVSNAASYTYQWQKINTKVKLEDQ